MFAFFAILTALAFVAVLATLIMGALSMKGHELSDRENSNKWMQRRVVSQASAIILLFITVGIKTKTGA